MPVIKSDDKPKRDMERLYDLLESLPIGSKPGAMIPGSFEVCLVVEQEYFYNLQPHFPDLDAVYAVYSKYDDVGLTVIHHIGTFSECLREIQ